MIDKQLIEKWVGEGLINEKQKEKMLSDIETRKKEERSNKFVVVLSTIGAILLGIGAIIFIAANWQDMSKFMKVFVLVGATMASYVSGFYFRYWGKNLPIVGSSLLFLSSLLFGADLILIAQIYNVEANSHLLVLTWLLGVLPMVYAFESKSSAFLSVGLFYLWMGLYLFKGVDYYSINERLLAPLFAIASIFIFVVGAFHYASDRLKEIAKTYRSLALFMLMFVIFLLTFDFLSTDYYYGDIRSYNVLPFVISVALTFLASFAALFFNPGKIQTSVLENMSAVVLAALMGIFYFYPTESSVYVLIFNLVFAGLIGLMMWRGIAEEKAHIVSMASFWLMLFILARYFDWFWGLLPTSGFFIIGGLILVMGGIALERNRRKLVEEFDK